MYIYLCIYIFVYIYLFLYIYIYIYIYLFIYIYNIYIYKYLYIYISYHIISYHMSFYFWLLVMLLPVFDQYGFETQQFVYCWLPGCYLLPRPYSYRIDSRTNLKETNPIPHYQTALRCPKYMSISY